MTQTDPTTADPTTADQWYACPQARQWTCDPPPLDPESFHRSMPGYQHTPLVDAAQLAKELGVGHVFAKDESARFGLPAFKMLGASWAVYRAVRALDPSWAGRPHLDDLRALRSRLGSITLVTATDGNHGRAVARMAGLIGASARIYVPDVVEPSAIALIEAESAEVIVLEEPYDSTVRRAADAAAADQDAILVQDTSWQGYEEIPQWIVDGYSTLFREIDTQLEQRGADPASLVVVPTGVGSLAQAAVAFHRSTRGEPASLLSVEPESAACLAASLRRKELVSVSTGRTNMAGLNCGTPSTIAWPYLLNGIDAAICVSDDQAELGSRDLEAAGASSGPCGGATVAALRKALAAAGADERRAHIGLSPTSTVVLLNTEGRPQG